MHDPLPVGGVDGLVMRPVTNGWPVLSDERPEVAAWHLESPLAGALPARP